MLKKLLKDEIRTRSRKNAVQARNFPPDLQEKATLTVLEEAELLANQ